MTVNPGFESLYNLANNKIDLGSNILCVVKDVVVKVDSSGFPVSTTSVSLDNIVTQIKGATVILAQNQTNSAIYPNAGVFVTLLQNNNTAIIQHVAGLPANSNFLLRLVVWG